MVALELPDAIHAPEQPLRLALSVAQGLADEGGAFVLADGKANGVTAASVEHHHHRQPVVVRGPICPIRLIRPLLLIQQLHIPTVHRPEEQRACRCAALHLHLASGTVFLRSVAAGKDKVVALVAPHRHRRGRDFLPVHLLGHHVVEPRHLLVVEVAWVAHEGDEHRLLVLVGHLRGILRAVLVGFVDEAGVALGQITLVFALKASGVGRQRVRPFRQVEFLHRLADFVPEARGTGAEGLAFRIAAIHQAAHGLKHDGVGVVFPPFVGGQMAVVVNHVALEILRGRRRVLNQALQHILPGLLARVAHALHDGLLIAVGHRVVGHQRGRVAASAAHHLDVATVGELQVIVLCHQSLLNHPSGFHGQYVVEVLHLFATFAA